MVLLVYVDNFIIGDDQVAIAKVEALLSAHFHTKGLSPLRSLLGIEVAQKGDSLRMT